MSSEFEKSIWTGSAVGISVLEEGVVFITFDNKEKSVNLLSMAVLQELERCLDALDQLNGVTGVIFKSAKDNCFIAGADINEILKAQSHPAEVTIQACNRGKRVFERIAQMAYPTVALINGRCLGGGLELALVCKKRLAADNDKTQFGFPELALGVLPGWGGTVRSARMLGLVAGAKLVLDPLKTVGAKKAWRMGLVSEVVAEDEIYIRAIAVAMGSRTHEYRPSFGEKLGRLLNNSLVGRVVADRVITKQIKKSKAKDYPAPYAALEVLQTALWAPLGHAMTIESQTFARLARTDESKTFVAMFLEHQRSKKANVVVKQVGLSEHRS